jgi:hypothetical protein
MSNSRRDYDSTVARIAGNILSGSFLSEDPEHRKLLAVRAVEIAREIVAEVRRAEPKPDPDKPF